MGESARRGLMRKTKYMIILDLALIALFISICMTMKPDYLVVIGYISFPPYLILTGRKKMIKHYFLATLMALTWMLFAHGQYGYNKDLLTIEGVNIFPLFAWANGLTVSYLLYSYLERLFRLKRFPSKFAVYVALYWPILIMLEAAAYHLFNFRNKATGDYPGLPFIDTIHAPVWMQISYILLGPLFFISSYLLDRTDDYRKEGLIDGIDITREKGDPGI